MTRRARWAWGLGLGAAIALGATFTVVHVTANTSFDEAASALDDAATDAADVRDALSDASDAGADAASAGQAIVDSAADDLVDIAARTALAGSVVATSEAVTAAEAARVERIARPDDKPLWTWELLAATPRMTAQTVALEADVDAMRDAESALVTAGEALTESAGALYRSVAPAAAALEAANISARTAAVLDFRDAAAAASAQTQVDSAAAVDFSSYAARATVLKESAQAELAEKAGRLLGTRLEIEAYARSIAGGVVLDFDWAPTVAGTGGREGIGGTATWNTGRGGFSTITLSHSVAENWPSADARALVTHEVGHAITSKCHEMFDSENQPANEEWATAWAISMGHTALGNGVYAYGYPSQAMIDVAATCR
ncbi:MAG: hypothetical protein ABWY55_07710 [Microbacterium sp.]